MKTVIAKVNSKGHYEVRCKEIRMERVSFDKLKNDLKELGFKVELYTPDVNETTTNEKENDMNLKEGFKNLKEKVNNLKAGLVETVAPAPKEKLDWDAVLDEALDEREVIEKILEENGVSDNITVYWDGEDKSDVSLSAEFDDDETETVSYNERVEDFIDTFETVVGDTEDLFDLAVEKITPVLKHIGTLMVSDYHAYKAKTVADDNDPEPISLPIRKPLEEAEKTSTVPTAVKVAGGVALAGLLLLLFKRKK